MRRLIWVYTVCLRPIKWTLGLYGLMRFEGKKISEYVQEMPYMRRTKGEDRTEPNSPPPPEKNAKNIGFSAIQVRMP